MRYGSLFSGIEAASVAWEPLGWKPQWFAEIDKFPCAVLAHHYPKVPNLGDVTKVEWEQYRGSIDVLVGGAPCQDFSVAGLRAGMAGTRGNLSLEFLRVLSATRPKWVVFENVPGLLSSNNGRDFGAFLGCLGQRGYEWSYRVLDAQYFGVPQRRRRVFVVGYLGDWRRAAAVLFEPESLRGDSPPRRGAGADTAYCVTSRFGSGRNDPTAETYIAHTLKGEGHDASEDGTGRGVPLVVAPLTTKPYGDNAAQESHLVAYQCQGTNVGEAGTLRGGNGNVTGGVPFIAFDTTQTTRHSDPGTIAFTCKDYGADVGDVAPTLRALEHDQSHANGGGQLAIVAPFSAVRRLTPEECEALQGFPRLWTLVPYRGKPAADGNRYRALGNSFAVPVVRWIGERIARVDAWNDGMSGGTKSAGNVAGTP